MMLYDDYLKSLERRKAIFNKIWKFRVLIALAFIFIVGLGTFLAFIGSIYGESYQKEIRYGDEYSFGAKAFLRDVNFEYGDGQTWSSEKPILCGNYFFRVTSRGLFGGEKLGNPHPYVILPASFEVKADPFGYGETPKFSADLKYGDSLNVSDFSLNRSGGVTLTVEKDDIKILDKFGNDVTFCYDITKSVFKANVTRRAVILKTGSDSFVYDGLAHKCERISVISNTLLSGHTISAQFVSLVDAGTIKNSASISILDETGGDVSSFYDISVEEGTLTVAKRQLTIITKSASVVYDGEAHSYPQFEAVGLIEGHTLSGETFDVTSLTAAGSTQNRFTVTPKISDGKRDVTANYEIAAYEYGVLTVEKRRVSITTGSATFVCDGMGHDCLDFVSDGEVVGHRLKAASTKITDITDDDKVRYVDNVLYFTALDGDGNDVTDCYEFIITYGKLRIKSPIVISLSPISKRYDGTPLSLSGGEFKIAVLPPDVSEEEAFNGIRIGGSLTDVGSLEVEDIEVNSAVGDNRVDVICATSPLTVLPREIEVTSISVSKHKGSDPLVGDVENAAWISLGSLAQGHTIEISVTGRLELNSSSAKNTIASVKIFGGEKDVTANYIITLKEGTLSWL